MSLWIMAHVDIRTPRAVNFDIARSRPCLILKIKWSQISWRSYNYDHTWVFNQGYNLKLILDIVTKIFEGPGVTYPQCTTIGPGLALRKALILRRYSSKAVGLGQSWSLQLAYWNWQITLSSELPSC